MNKVRTGEVTGLNGNLVKVKTGQAIVQNEVVFRKAPSPA